MKTDLKCPKCNSGLIITGSDCYPESGVGLECYSITCDFTGPALSYDYRSDKIKEALLAAWAVLSSVDVVVLPCPFCGKSADMDESDTLHKSGTCWRDDESLGMRTYHGFRERAEGDGMCWVMNCPTIAGGCGAEIHGDSREETLAAWNRRAHAVESVDPSKADQG